MKMQGAVQRQKVLLVTDFRGLIPQRIQAWDGYDLDRIAARLEAAGLETVRLGAHQVDVRSVAAQGRTAALYASSQQALYKQYLTDLVANLHFCGVVLFPGLEHMLAHEDKAYQAFRLTRTTVPAPASHVFGSRDEALTFLANARFPLMGKAPAGYGSSGVRVLRSQQQAVAFLDLHLKHRMLRKGRSFPRRALERVLRPRPILGLVIFQELVSDLDGDWKVLIWGDKACGLFRKNRPGDLRASGSGLVDFRPVPEAVLDFALRARLELDLPWGSFDVGCRGDECFLLEYQGLHFGLTTAERGKFFYERTGQGWTMHPGRIAIEDEMADLMLVELARRGWDIGRQSKKPVAAEVGANQ